MAAKSKKDLDRKVVETALRLAASRGWSRTGLGDIARGARISLPELHAHFPAKHEILVALGRMIDAQVLENITTSGDPEDTPRDRLFEVMMERFDALNEHREGILAIVRSYKRDPAQALISMPYLCSSMHWMLEAAGISTSGKRGVVKVAGLTALYVSVVRTWVHDDTPDLAKTMAALDRALERAERYAGMMGLDKSDTPPPYQPQRKGQEKGQKKSASTATQ